jgi:hypothetical protein
MRRLVKRRHSDAGGIAALNWRRTGRRHALRRSRFEAQFFAPSGQELVDGVDGFRRHSFAASQGHGDLELQGVPAAALRTSDSTSARSCKPDGGIDAEAV